MKRIGSLLSVGAMVLMAHSCSPDRPGPAPRESAQRPAVEYAPTSIVAVPSGASAEHKALAKEIAASLGSDTILEQPVNPVCCIWVEINGFVPYPTQDGYVIINGRGGSIVTASSVEQLRAAVDRFKKTIRQRDGMHEVPIGLLTNYRVVSGE
jgi:hypothetical protein